MSIIFPGQLHLAQSVKGQVSGWHFIFIDLKALLDTVAPPSWEGAAPVGYSRLANIVRPQESPGIALLTEYLIQELSRKQSGYETAVKGCALSLASLITRAINQAADHKLEIATVDRTSINKISKSLHYISQHYMEPIHIEELAAICNLSNTHFRRTFRACMGSAPLDYLIHMRMQMASALLCHTDSSILSISEKVGYSTLSSFNRHFKIWMGAAPSKWRVMNR
ncbi:HTH-type transcriptional regulator CdhR [compost metagenome]